jgi:hypothetical protein
MLEDNIVVRAAADCYPPGGAKCEPLAVSAYQRSHGSNWCVTPIQKNSALVQLYQGAAYADSNIQRKKYQRQNEIQEVQLEPHSKCVKNAAWNQCRTIPVVPIVWIAISRAKRKLQQGKYIGSLPPLTSVSTPRWPSYPAHAAEPLCDSCSRRSQWRALGDFPGAK